MGGSEGKAFIQTERIAIPDALRDLGEKMPRTSALVRRNSRSIEISLTAVQRRIHMIRGVKVMLDEDLAAMYGVETKRLNEAVKRNARRFPDDFMFTLNREELAALRAEFAMCNRPMRGGRRYAPQVFTDLGVAMLSSVLNSEYAIQANIQVMRAFVQVREIVALQQDLSMRVDSLERGQESHSEAIGQLYAALSDFTRPAEPPRRRFGFSAQEESAEKGRRGRSRAKRLAPPTLPGRGGPAAE